MFDWSLLDTVGFVLVIAGFAITFLAAVLLALQTAITKGKSETKGGGVIVVGPFPIVFGTDKETVKILLALSILLTVLVIVLMLLSRNLL
ncbi:MAG: TIGR00304 family membrane protein [Candidatus Bathyarchaeales archaeon]